jgi:transcriptional regulator with XRE-family HTH domain
LFTFQHLRKSQGITQVELAQEAEINRTTLSKIESGQRNATLDVLMRLASALGKKLEIKLT